MYFAFGARSSEISIKLAPKAPLEKLSTINVGLNYKPKGDVSDCE